MILIAGIPTEPPVKFVTDAAIATGIPYVLFNQREAHHYEMSLQYMNNQFQGFIRIGGQEYDLAKFTGIYMRMMEYYYLPEIKNKVFNYIGDALAEKSIAIHQQFLNWLEIASCRILNRPSDMLSNMSKPFQYQIISSSGLRIPPTCITSDEQVVLQFRTKYKNLIYKSISSARSIVQEFTQNKMKQLRKVRNLPTQFQQKLMGTNIRVHVVGETLFATKIETPVVDYRYAERENEKTNLLPVQLPKQIKKRCFKLSQTLNLPLCGIDLFRTMDGVYYCFEVNPSPGFSYYQANTGQDIASAIVTYLEYGKSEQ
jgi:glutathione synthase/RimK-type ligase-like ATP-grasp enzyme